MDYERVARATTYGPDGKDILIMKDLRAMGHVLEKFR
jgi:hypothetical protein